MSSSGKPGHNPDQTMIFKAGTLAYRPEIREGTIAVIRGGRADLGKSRVVGAGLVFGRGSDCDMVLADMQISSHHARIFPGAGGGCLLEDLGSTNGTRLNGIRLQMATELHDGDKIFAGETVLRFTMADTMDLGYHDELEQLVRVDALTGLEAKHCFDDALTTAVAQAQRSGKVLSLLMMDMDGLKAINDRHGHPFGAYAIAETGRLIGRLLPAAAHACRFGGDEFMLLLPDGDKPAAVLFAERLRRQLEQAGFARDGVALRPTLSIGVASCPDDAASAEALVAAADAALYRAKRAGKNRVSL